MAKGKRKQVKATKQDTDICFVIMPFGGYFDQYYNDIYCTAITRSGMTPKRADDLYRPSNIVQDIWGYTKKAKIILADLSTKNPNVFYELGLAHAIAKPAILITETMDDVPFDLRSLRILEYDKNKPNWGDKLMLSIEAAIKETLKSPNETIPSAFLETTTNLTPKVTKREKDIIELKQEIEILKREIRSRNYIGNPNVIVSDDDDDIISPNKAFMKPLQPSPALAKIVGSKPLPRTEIAKKFWAYIQEHNLQDKKNKRMINTNASLLPIFGDKNQVSMFEMAKLLSKHLA